MLSKKVNLFAIKHRHSTGGVYVSLRPCNSLKLYLTQSKDVISLILLSDTQPWWSWLNTRRYNTVCSSNVAFSLHVDIITCKQVTDISQLLSIYSNMLVFWQVGKSFILVAKVVAMSAYCIKLVFRQVVSLDFDGISVKMRHLGCRLDFS